MFRPGTKKYRNPHSVRLCGFFVVRESPRESPEASSFSTIISTTRAVVLNSVVLRGNMDKKTRETGTNRLTDTKVKTAKAETKESTLLDGEGLELRVKPNGGKRWVFKYQRPADKKRTNMGFGTYPEVW